MNTDVGGLIRAAREQAKLFPADLARLVGYNQSTVSRWESNGSRPTRDAPQRLVEVLGLDPDEFYRALGTAPAPTPAVDVESAIRADPSLTADAKVQLLSLYRYLQRDRDDRYADDRLAALPQPGDVTETSPSDAPGDVRSPD